MIMIGREYSARKGWSKIEKVRNCGFDIDTTVILQFSCSEMVACLFSVSSNDQAKKKQVALRILQHKQSGKLESYPFENIQLASANAHFCACFLHSSLHSPK